MCPENLPDRMAPPHQVAATDGRAMCRAAGLGQDVSDPVGAKAAGLGDGLVEGAGKNFSATAADRCRSGGRPDLASRRPGRISGL